MLFQSILFRGLLVVMSGVGVLVVPAFGATIDVDESAPGVGAVVVNTTDGLCSLREAITNANANNQSGSAECEAGSGADTIVLPSNAIFTLTDAAILDPIFGNTGLPMVTSDITIRGNGATIQRDSLACDVADFSQAASEFRLIHLDFFGSLTVENATLRNGCIDRTTSGGGGAILANGDLTLRGVTVIDNVAGNRGGGIDVTAGNALVTESLFASNTSQGSGGGIRSASFTTLRNTTFSSNSAFQGGGVYVGNRFRAHTFENLTFVDNSATNSGGGIFSSNTSINGKNLVLQNSPCAESSTVFTPVWNAEGSSFDNGTTCSSIFTVPAGSNFTGSATLALGALADNGGPTMTHALGATSAAIDAVALTDCSQPTDQRGVARPQGTLCDAGAFEVVVPLSSPATINVDESSAGVGAVVVDPYDGLCSIREAIANANDSSTGMVHPDCEQGYPGGADTIILPSAATFTLPDAVEVSFNGDTGLPYIGSAITIQGNGSRLERDSTLPCNINGSKAAGEFRVLAVLSAGHLILEDASVTNSCVDPSPGNGAGGGIWNRGRLTLRRVEVANHAVYSLGGGINSDSSLPVLIEDSLIAGNSVASGSGGGLFARTGMTIRNSTISGNSATSSGGAMVLTLQAAGIHTLENVTFSENTAPSASGISITSGTIRAQNIVMQDATCLGSSSGYVAGGANFDSGTSCSGLFGSNFTSNAVLNLGPLADNGGPTRTHALGTGSAAIDAVPDGQCTPFGGGAAFTIDQRGETRPLDGNGDGTALCDAGAFEVAGLTIDDVTVTEDPTTATFTISRGPATVGTSTVQADTADGTATAGADYTAIVAQTVTIPDGTSSATIVVPILEDLIDEGAGENYFVDLTSSSNAAVADAQGLGTITDDDTAMIAIGDATVTEGDAGTVDATFTVSLSNQASSNVTVDYATADGTASAGLDYTAVPPTTLTFLPGETSKNVTVTVTGDTVDEANETFFVDLSNASHAIADAQGLGTITDDDAATISIDDVTVTEGDAGTVDATFTVSLSNQVSSDVTVDYATADDTASAGLDYTAIPTTTLTFTPGETSKNVTVAVLGDMVDEANETFFVTLSNGSHTIADTQGLGTITDDDTAGVTLSKVAVATSETGAADSFTVVLDAEPTADVTLTITSGDTTEGLLSDGDETDQGSVTLTFTPANWGVAQTVTVTGQDDVLTDGNQTYNITTTTASGDLVWNGLTVATVSATNNDDDTPGVDVTPVSGLVTTEGGGTATFDVVLNAQPTADVSIDFGSNDTTEGLVSTDGVTEQSTVTLTFTPGDWNVPQTVTVHGQDDLVTDGDQGYSVTSSAVSSADPTWNGIAVGDVAVTNQDDEVSSITLTPTSGLLTTEGGATDSFTIVLTSEPTADVEIVLSSSDPGEGSVSPTSVTFTAANWNVAQTVTVTGVDDDVDDGDQAWNVVTADAISTDPTYDGTAVADPSVLNVDDDTRGVTVTPATGLVTTEAGGSDTFTLVLDSEPLTDVVIALSSSNTAEGAVSPASVTFTSGNWNVGQSVTVTGVDDVLADGDQPYTIVTDPAVSGDPGYSGLAVADVTVTNLDDETTAGDSDGDGVPDTVEDAAPNGGDGNGDGISDSMQPSVASLPAANGNGYLTVISTCQLRDVEARLKDDFEPTMLLFPYALVEFRLPCTSADLSVLYHAGDGWEPEVGYWKYGPETPGQSLTTKWYQLPGVVFDTTTVNGATVARASFPLADGQLGDDTGVDGEIVDQGGPGAPGPVNSIPTASEWMLLMMIMALASVGVWKLR